MLPLGIG